MASQKSSGNMSRRTDAHCAHFTSAAPHNETEKWRYAHARRRNALRVASVASSTFVAPRASEDANRAIAGDSAASNRGTARKNTGRNASVR